MISGFSNKKRNDHFSQYIFKAITQKSKFNGKTIPVSFFQEDILSIIVKYFLFCPVRRIE